MQTLISDYMKRDAKRPRIESNKKKEEKKIVDSIVSKYIISSGINYTESFRASFQVVCELIGRYGSGYRPPSEEELRAKLFENQIAKFDELKKKRQLKWMIEGCTLMVDGWTDQYGRGIINFLVNCSEGTLYLYSIDACANEKTDDFIVSSLEAAMKVIGVENVVHVCTHNAANYVRAGKILMEKYNHLYWTPCVAHCIDLIIKDIGMIPKFKKLIAMGRKITSLIHNHAALYNGYMELSDENDLVRCGVTNSVTSFLTLENIKEKRGLLRSIDWLPWNGIECGDLVSRALFNNDFWISLDDYLRVLQPLIALLRMVVSDQKPCMSYISHRYQKAHREIKDHLGNDISLLTPITEILEKRWDKNYQMPLFGAGVFLNPKVYYEGRKSCDPAIIKYEMDFNLCLERMVDDLQIRMKISDQVLQYKGRLGHFATSLATNINETMDPLKWWNSFGITIPDLMSLAIRILRLCCTASSRERNWSTFELVRKKPILQTEAERLRKLAYIGYNLRIQDENQHMKQNQNNNYDPIFLGDVNFCSEWTNFIAGPSEEFFYNEDGLTWADRDYDYPIEETEPDEETLLAEFGRSMFDKS